MRFAVAFFFSIVVTSCSNANLTGPTDSLPAKKPKPQVDPLQSDLPSGPGTPENPKTPADKLDDPQAKSCLANLDISAVDAAGADDIGYLEENSFSPFAQNIIRDEKETEYERVVIVKADAFGPVVNFDLNLLNPKGIYCLTTTSKSVFTNVKITMCRTARIGSDSRTYMAQFKTMNILKVKC